MATRYEHSGNAAATTLSTSITNASTSITIASATGWPTGSVGPFWITLDRGTSSEEKVLVTSRTGTTLTVQTRGADGTTATAHAAGAVVEHTISATEVDDANQAAVKTSPVTGALVGTTDTQTLTNKTLASPTFSGTAQGGTFNNTTLTNPSGVGRGTVAYTAVTTSQGSIGGTATDVTGLSASFTAVAGRRYRVHAHGYFSSTGVNGYAQVKIMEGTTRLTESTQNMGATAAVAVGVDAFVIVQPAAGSHSYKVQAAQVGGSGTMTANGNAEFPMFILVEDIGT